ncbi:MAG: uL15m family ribosomal protein [Candidatus Micrarchaeaceae archaeon]
MVVRKERRGRKYLGSRRWGVGNIKNARGAGDRGGVGKGKRKHRFTYFTANAPEFIGKRGFTHFGRKRLHEITLAEIERKISATQKEGATKEVELRGYKVLSNGVIGGKIIIRASAFSAKALEKIKSAGGEAVLIGKESNHGTPQPQ